MISHGLGLSDVPSQPIGPPLWSKVFAPPPNGAGKTAVDAKARQKADILKATLNSLDLPVDVREIVAGPATTRFGLKLGTRSNEKRVRVAEVEARRKDIQVELGTRNLRLVTPLISKVGESLVGIEITNDKATPVTMADALYSLEYASDTRDVKFALGMDVEGSIITESISDLPHALVAGQTGSGKSIFLHALICQLILQHGPDELQLVLCDPKHVEFGFYANLPHLMVGKSVFNYQHGAVLHYPSELMMVLQHLTGEMDSRLNRFQLLRKRNITEYNEMARIGKQPIMPYIVVVVDEYAEVFAAAGDDAKDLARSVQRLAQKARAAGIHLVFATQRPSVKVIGGDIKANFPARFAFAVPSDVDSKVILNEPGAESLRGKGDMLYAGPNNSVGLQRVQGVYVSTDEIEQIVNHWAPPNSAAPPAQSLPPTQQGALI